MHRKKHLETAFYKITCSYNRSQGDLESQWITETFLVSESIAISFQDKKHYLTHFGSGIQIWCAGFCPQPSVIRMQAWTLCFSKAVVVAMKESDIKIMYPSNFITRWSSCPVWNFIQASLLPSCSLHALFLPANYSRTLPRKLHFKFIVTQIQRKHYRYWNTIRTANILFSISMVPLIFNSFLKRSNLDLRGICCIYSRFPGFEDSS